jgi:uncharacterized protein (DUF433 family)
MNQQLVDSLIQVIESLPPDERHLLESRLREQSIQKTPGVCGGHACIHNSRIPVWTIVSFRLQGADQAEVLRNFPSLTPQDLTLAWNYYENNRQEIDKILSSNEEDEEIDG